MADIDLELDHVGLATVDLDQAADAYQRLGFTLTPRSIHQGQTRPDGPVEPWGQGNHCAMFRDGYLEILGITDPDKHNGVAPLLAKYEGIHVTAYTVDDAEAAYPELSARVDGLKPPLVLERDAAFGPDGTETRRAGFRNIGSMPEIWPEARFIFIQHVTREVLWQPHLLDHPNGAVAMTEVGYCVADPGPLTDRLSRAAGIAAKENAMPGINALQLGRTRAYIMTPDGMAGWIKGVTPPHLPYVATFGVSVADLGATKAYLSANDIPVNDHPYPAVWVAPEYTHGPVVSFIQA